MSVTNVTGYDYHYFILHIALPAFEVSTQKMIYTHNINVHDKRYYTKCTDCYLNFNTKNYVDTHMVNIHDKKIFHRFILQIVIIVIKSSTQKYS